MRTAQEKKKLHFSFQEDFPCPYFKDGRTATIECLIADSKLSNHFHISLSKGYRRMGSIFYRNICRTCSSCIPIRLETKKFKVSRSQKRTLKKNADIRIRIFPTPFMSDEKIELYGKYLNLKHKEKRSVDNRSYEAQLSALHYGYMGTIEMNYYDKDRLIGVGIIDEGTDALSANYFYYDTHYFDRRPGVFSVLQEISLAGQLRKRYYYLGFYIKENPKMAYKKFFRPNQIYRNRQWKDFLT